MFNKFFKRFMRRRHYWRDVNFDELSELYVSMMFRSLAMGLVGIFIPIYLYQHGEAIWEILLFYTYVYTAQLFISPISAYVIAKIGPKHTILISHVVQAVALTGLFFIDVSPVPLLCIALLYGVALGLFFTSYHVDFSKVKHSDHGGKEIGWMYTMQKIGTVLGPLLGGVIAYIFGAEYIFAIALSLLLLGALPLLLTREPVQINQKIRFSNLKLRPIIRDISADASLAVESSISIVIWPLFVGIVVFGGGAYLQLGSVASVSIVSGLLAARVIGVLIDKRNGRNLLRFSAILNAIVHLFRPFANGFPFVVAVNLVNEAVTAGYIMPLTKGLYGAADEHVGQRIVYICTIEAFGNFVRVLVMAFAAIVAFMVSDQMHLFGMLFGIGAIASLLITTERFKALRG